MLLLCPGIDSSHPQSQLRFFPKMKLNQPLDIALVGTGFRSQTVYRLLFAALRGRGVRLVAVCDPVRKSADAYAESLGVRAFYSIRELVAARPMEAAIICTPVELFHPISSYLSQHGIHNIVEAGFSHTLTQARAMIRTAQENNVVLAVGEQFFRLGYERLAERVAATGFLGPVNRIISVFTHTGTHNNGCWIRFFGAHPDSAQAVNHTMAVDQHVSLAHRTHVDETFHAHFFTFPGNRLVADMTSNPKGVLGRMQRPGYTQYEGTRGTILLSPAGHWNGPYHQVEGEVRYCSDLSLATNGIVDTVYPFVFQQENEFMKALHVDLPTGRVSYTNPFYRPVEEAADVLDYYHAATAELLLEFAQAIRGETTLEYTPEDAYASLMMSVATRESVLNNGAKVALPLDVEVESEAQTLAALKARTGIDPLDVEGMLEYVAPRA
jgi:predicted dehydrogenase